LRAVATLDDQSHRTAKAIAWIAANYAKTLRVEELAQMASMGRIHAASSFPDAYFDESTSVSKTTPASVSAESDAEQWPRCGQRGF
jgi:transcriptional regulator GlxA family with amidase domain